MNYNILRSQIKRHSSDFLDFNSLLREHHLLIPSFDFFDLTDIRFRFYTQPSFQPLLPAQALFGVRDLRFYINGLDYSKYFKQELKYVIGLTDMTTIKSQYQKAATSWINYLEHYKDAMGVNIAEEKNILNRLITDVNFDNQLKVFGGKEYGFGGNLHILNYLYKNIEIENLSLKRIINYRQKDIGKPEIDFSNFEAIKFTISQGPSPSFEDFNAIEFQPRGRMYYFMEYIYNNPIEELLQIILNKITDTQKWVETQRINYLEPLRNQMDALETETNEKFQEYKTKIDILKKVIEENFPKNQ